MSWSNSVTTTDLQASLWLMTDIFHHRITLGSKQKFFWIWFEGKNINLMKVELYCLQQQRFDAFVGTNTIFRIWGFTCSMRREDNYQSSLVKRQLPDMFSLSMSKSSFSSRWGQLSFKIVGKYLTCFGSSCPALPPTYQILHSSTNHHPMFL